jgi:hypothetical protein
MHMIQLPLKQGKMSKNYDLQKCEFLHIVARINIQNEFKCVGVPLSTKEVVYIQEGTDSHHVTHAPQLKLSRGGRQLYSQLQWGGGGLI